MRFKHIKLNVLVSFLLIIILLSAFALFFSCALTGINNYAKISYEKFQTNTKDSSEGIFVVDIEQQASMAEEIFYTASNVTKIVAYYIFGRNEIQKQTDEEIKLNYNQDEDIYFYMKDGKSTGTAVDKIGTLVICRAENYLKNKEKFNYYLNVFNKAESVLKRVCANNYMYTGAWIVIPDGMLIYLSLEIKDSYKLYGEKKFKELKNILSYFDNKSEKSICSKVYRNEAGENIISVMHPEYKNGNLIAVTGIDLQYSDILEALYCNVLRKYYEKYNIIRLFIDDRGFLMFYPREYMELLSIPVKNTSMILEKSNLYNVNLNLSQNPTVRKLANKLLNNDHGKEKIKINGKEYLVSFKALSVNNWRMAVMISTDDLYKDLYDLEKTLHNTKKHIYVRFTVTFLIIAFLCLIISIFIFNKQLVRPIEELCRKIKLLGKGNFKIKFDEKGIHEIYDLSKSFNILGTELEEYIIKFEKEVRNRQSVEKEIKLARKIQENIIPVLEDEFDSENFLIKGKLEPAKDVSGDFYDVFYINENIIAFIVADVSGKGFPAAFFMAIARTAIRNICLLQPEYPAEVLKQANKTLCDNNKTSMFVTAFLGFYEIDTGKLSYCNAGHLPPIMYTEKGSKLYELETVCNPPLGCIDDFEFTNFEKHLNEKDILILFTDGVTEAENRNKELFGTERLKQFIQENIELTGEKFLDCLFKTLFKYQNNRISDDITVFFLKRRK